jgi:hypothetical protein
VYFTLEIGKSDAAPRIADIRNSESAPSLPDMIGPSMIPAINENPMGIPSRAMAMFLLSGGTLS